MRELIRRLRKAVRQQLQQYCPRGRRPHLQVIVDLTTLEKRGKFKAFEPLVSVLHGKRGMHLVVLYLVVGPLRIPWSFQSGRAGRYRFWQCRLPQRDTEAETPCHHGGSL